MAATRNAVLRGIIEGVLTDLMVKTKVDNVYVDDTTTLAAKLSEIIASLNSKVTTSAMNAAISQAVNDLINGAPNTYDTLKEISDYISAHEDVVDALNSAIGDKADKITVQSLQNALNALGSMASKNTVTESDLDSSLKNKINAASNGTHSHNNKSVLDGITAEKVSEWDGKGNLYIQAQQPANMGANDLWAMLI